MNGKKSVFLILAISIFFGCNTSADYNNVLENPTQPNSKYPYLYSVENKLYMSWISSNADGSHSLKYSIYQNEQWDAVNTIATDSTWFVNWADFPSIIANKNGPIAAHWLDLINPGPLAYDIKITTAAGPKKWNKSFIPHKDGTSSEHGFVSMIPWNDDSFIAVWLDGRETEGRTGEEYYNIKYAMTLRGAIINREGTIKQSFLIDDSVCDCCPTSLIKTQNGAAVAYRNRTDEEIRDIYISRFNGEKWSEPQAVYNDNWEIGACPVNGPKLAAEDSTVALAWHTAANEQPTAKVAISSDNGQTFGTPLTLNEGTSLGRVDVGIDNEKTIVSWMEKNNDSTALNAAAIAPEKIIAKKTIAEVSESRKTGFPQMAIVNGELVFAWTKVDEELTQIETRQVSFP